VTQQQSKLTPYPVLRSKGFLDAHQIKQLDSN